MAGLWKRIRKPNRPAISSRVQRDEIVGHMPFQHCVRQFYQAHWSCVFRSSEKVALFRTPSPRRKVNHKNSFKEDPGQ